MLRCAGDEAWRLTGLRLARAVQALALRPAALLDSGPRLLAAALSTPVGQRTRLQRSAVLAGSTVPSSASGELRPFFPVVQALDSIISELCGSLTQLDTSDGQVRAAASSTLLTRQELLKVANVHLHELVYLWQSVDSDRGASQIILRSLADAVARCGPSSALRALAHAVESARSQGELATGRAML